MRPALALPLGARQPQPRCPPNPLAPRRLEQTRPNTLPGSLAYYLWEASGVPFDRLVAQLVDGALRRHTIRRNTQFAMDTNLLTAARA